MTDARETILQSIREASQAREVSSTEIAAEADALLQEANAVRPSLPTHDIVDNFVARVTGPKVGATVDRIAAIEELPTIVVGEAG